MKNLNKYMPYPKVNMSNRKWVDRKIEKAPVWCSVDLRDGNQALSQPMNIETKVNFFKLLVAIGFKEIEVGFPAASEIEYLFVRKLIEENLIPDDVTIQVLTQSRKHLIHKTMEAVKGVNKLIVHIYNSTSKVQREVVFNKSDNEIIDIAVTGVKEIKDYIAKNNLKEVSLEYSPESFTGTELPYALKICEAVIDVWQPTMDNRIIINLPATVEMSTPNIFADRIEWFCSNVKNRENVIISIHTHNDRGTAVAAAELGVMAGADRVEGSLFGNGERSGNMDLITFALNLYSQGVDPELDLSDINHILKVYTECTNMLVHSRHPYVGELVYTAFSGSHQDAIRKGIKSMEKTEQTAWNVPYLPIDPKDLGRYYEAIIRINSQSGKGGIAYVLETEFGIILPKWMQADFSKHVQKLADENKKELSNSEVFDLFGSIYVNILKPLSFNDITVDTEENKNSANNMAKTRVIADIVYSNQIMKFEEFGSGAVDAIVKGFKKQVDCEFSLENYAEHSLTKGEDSDAIAFIELRNNSGDQFFGVGIDSSISIASVKAVFSALNHMV